MSVSRRIVQLFFSWSFPRVLRWIPRQCDNQWLVFFVCLLLSRTPSFSPNGTDWRWLEPIWPIWQVDALQQAQADSVADASRRELALQQEASALRCVAFWLCDGQLW